MLTARVQFCAALWAFLLVPSACLLGILAHPCPCDSEAACEHEWECEADPCNTDIDRIPGLCHRTFLMGASAPASPILAGTIDPAPPPRLAAEIAGLQPAIPRLPVPAASLPLLC